MDRAFSSVEEIADQFWSPQPSSSAAATGSKLMRMNRSSSEWAFQRFLQEADYATTNQQNDDIVEIKENHQYSGEEGVNGLELAADCDEYQAFLKSRLDLACAAVALTRASNGKAQESAAPDNGAPELGSHASESSQLGSHVTHKASEQDSSKLQDKDAGGPIGVPPLPAICKKSGAQVKSTTSGSSVEQSDDDEAEGENEANQGPTDAKRMRRMLSNRESARRSRRRKQAHLTDLETQVGQFRVENSSLLKRFTDISHKYNEAAVDNRVLKADVETLRAKVKMAEETVKRVTGLNPLFQAMSEMSTIGLPSFASSPDTSADTAVPVQGDPSHHYYHAPSNGQTCVQEHRIHNGVVDNIPPVVEDVQPNKMGITVSMQRVASLEHLQKCIRGASGSSGAQE